MDLSCRQLVIGLIAVGSIVGFLMGWIPTDPAAIRVLPLADVSAPSLKTVSNNNEWKPGAVFPSRAVTTTYQALTRYGSWVGGDTFRGEHYTNWYRAAPHIVIIVAGYPNVAGNRLSVDLCYSDGRIEELRFNGANPREAWEPWFIDLPPGVEMLRVRGVDGLSAARGWLAFSEPGASSLAHSLNIRMVLQTLGTGALAILVLLGPGLLLHARGHVAFVDVIWPGPLAMAAGGLLTWGLGGWIKPSIVAFGWVGACTLITLLLSWRWRVWSSWKVSELLALGMIPLCVLGAMSKAAFSGGPAGELYGGMVSRTLEIGDRSDSRISFHNVQLIANHLRPYEPEGTKYFLPWSFSSRGPLAGLVAAPIVLATGGKPPLEFPEQPWVPYDPEGFAAFRIAMITLSSLALVAVAGLVRMVADERSASLGVALLALSPFFWHELYFTWPKLATGTWVLGAFSLLQRGRLFAGGVALGGAYLLHPMALLSAPFLALWAVATKWTQGRRIAIVKTAGFCVGIILAVATWRLINTGHFAQDGFLKYFFSSDPDPSVGINWLLSRWNNLANTLIPLYAWTFNASHASFSALGMRSDRWVQFFFQYWTSAPFAIGILSSFALFPAFFQALVRQRAAAILFLVGPFLFLVLYWGAASTGLMREAGHVLFLTGWVFLVWAASDLVPRFATSLTFMALRSMEVLMMMFIPALLGSGFRLPARWVINDALWLGITVTAVFGVAVAAWAATNSDKEMVEHRSAGLP